MLRKAIDVEVRAGGATDIGDQVLIARRVPSATATASSTALVLCQLDLDLTQFDRGSRAV